MNDVLEIAAGVVLYVVFFVWVMWRWHQRKHLFYVHCPWCRRDPYRIMLMRDMMDDIDNL